jgi:hypothetical protein
LCVGRSSNSFIKLALRQECPACPIVGVRLISFGVGSPAFSNGNSGGHPALGQVNAGDRRSTVSS